LELTVASEGTINKQLKLSRRIRLTDRDVQFLNEYKGKPVPPKVKNLRLDFEVGPNTNCFVAWW
jgi:hypothetical protein